MGTSIEEEEEEGLDYEDIEDPEEGGECDMEGGESLILFAIDCFL